MNFEYVFPDHSSVQQTEVDDILRSYWIIITGEYVINRDHSIDVIGDVKFPDVSNFLKEIPLNFNIVSGDFDCSGLDLITLKGSPSLVGGIFNCSYNRLTSLEFAPKKAGKLIFDNSLKSLSTGTSNSFDQTLMLFRNSETHLSDIFDLYQEVLPIIFKYQSHFEVWNAHHCFNIQGFNDLIAEINEGLE